RRGSALSVARTPPAYAFGWPWCAPPEIKPMTNDNTNLPATIPPKPIKERRVSALVKRACDLFSGGEAKSLTHAAELLGCSREHLSRSFGKPHVKTYLARRAGRKISLAVLRAATVK